MNGPDFNQKRDISDKLSQAEKAQRIMQFDAQLHALSTKLSTQPEKFRPSFVNYLLDPSSSPTYNQFFIIGSDNDGKTDLSISISFSPSGEQKLSLIRNYAPIFNNGTREEIIAELKFDITKPDQKEEFDDFVLSMLSEVPTAADYN